MKKLLATLIFAMLPLVAFAQATNDYLDTTKDKHKKNVMLLALAQIKQDLKDPDSAKFKSIYYNISEGGLETTCGTINAKNSYGAYVGFRPFFNASKPAGKSEAEKKITLEDVYGGRLPLSVISGPENEEWFLEAWKGYCKPKE